MEHLPGIQFGLKPAPGGSPRAGMCELTKPHRVCCTTPQLFLRPAWERGWDAIVSGAAAGALTIRGVVLTGLAAGGEDVVGAVVAPLYFRIGNSDRFEGASVGAFKLYQGEQHGLTIGSSTSRAD